MVVRKTVEKILSKTDINERIATWAANRKNSVSLAIDEVPYVCLALVLVGFSLGFLLGNMS